MRGLGLASPAACGPEGWTRGFTAVVWRTRWLRVLWTLSGLAANLARVLGTRRAGARKLRTLVARASFAPDATTRAVDEVLFACTPCNLLQGTCAFILRGWLPLAGLLLARSFAS